MLSKSPTNIERATSGSALNVCSSLPMEEGDRESSSLAGMALPVEVQPGGDPGSLVVQEGGFLASMT